MATFDSIFPTFLAKCGELHTLLLSVAFALFIVGVIVTVKHHSSHKSILDLLVRLLLLTSLLVFLPAWGNTLQNLLQTSILSGLGVDPANVYQQFNQLLIIKRDPATTNVLVECHVAAPQFYHRPDHLGRPLARRPVCFTDDVLGLHFPDDHPESRLRALALAHRFHGNPGVEAHRQPLPDESCRRFVVAVGLGARRARHPGHSRFHDRPSL